MKNKILAALIIFAVGISQAYAADTTKKKAITFASDEWCPYTCNDKNRPGFIAEIIKEVFGKAGYETEIIFMPWKRSLEEVENGKYNANTVVNVVEGENMLIPEEPTGISIYKYFVRADSKWRYNGIKSLEQITLGVQEDIDYGSEIDEYVQKNLKNHERIQFISAETSFDKNIKKVLAGRIDAFFEDKFVVGNYLKVNNLEGKIVDAGTSVKLNELSEELIYVGFSKKIPESKIYSEILTQGVRKLRKSGKLKIILDKYGVTDWDDMKKNAKQFNQ